MLALALLGPLAITIILAAAFLGRRRLKRLDGARPAVAPAVSSLRETFERKVRDGDL